MGQKEAIQAQAALPTPENKKHWLEEILARNMSFPKLRAAMRSFHILTMEELSQASVASYFEEIPSFRRLMTSST